MINGLSKIHNFFMFFNIFLTKPSTPLANPTIKHYIYNTKTSKYVANRK